MMHKIGRIRPDVIMALQSNNNKTYVNVYYNTALALVHIKVTTSTYEPIKNKMSEIMKEM
mgnify:CR=1 FL=1